MKTHDGYYEQGNLRWNICQWAPWTDTDAEAQKIDSIDTLAFLTDSETGTITPLT